MRPLNSGQAIEKRALSGAFRPNDRADLAAPDREIHSVERGEPTKSDSDVLGAEDRGGGRIGRHSGRRRSDFHQAAGNLQAGGNTVFSFGTTSTIRYLPSWIS